MHQSPRHVVAVFSCDLVILSFGSTFWIQSVQFEVFTMNNMFICIVLFLTVQFYYHYWREENEKRSPSLFPSLVVFPIALKGAFVAALSLGNQHTIVFYLIPIILAIFLSRLLSRELSFSRFLLLAAAFLAGGLPYLHLVIASFTPRKGNWGDMTTWTGFASSSPPLQASSTTSSARTTEPSSSSRATTTRSGEKCSSGDLSASSKAPLR